MNLVADLAAHVSSGIPGLILGAVIGVIAGAILEDAIKKRGRRIWKFSRKHLLSRRVTYAGDTFRWGPMLTPALILEGDGQHIIDEQSVYLIVDKSEATLPSELQDWKHEIEQEQLRRRQNGEPHFWNGLNYAVAGITVSRRVDDESPEVFVRLNSSDYYTFLATQNLDRKFSDGTTPRERYITPFAPDKVPAFMSCSFGTNVAVITSDDKIIFSQRSERVGSHPGFWNSSANEALSRDIDSAGRAVPNIYNVARRGVQEELGIEPQEYRIDLLAITLDRSRHQWGALFIARLFSLTGEGFLERRTRGMPDKWEHQNHELVTFGVGPVVRFIFDRRRRHLWAPTAPALFYMALVNQYGRLAVERQSAHAIRKMMRKDPLFRLGE